MGSILPDRLRNNYEKGIKKIGCIVLAQVCNVLLIGTPVTIKLNELSSTQQKKLFNQDQINIINSGRPLNGMDNSLLHAIIRAFGNLVVGCPLDLSLKPLKTLRNIIAHEDVNLTKPELRTKLVDLEAKLTNILNELKPYCTTQVEKSNIDQAINVMANQLHALENTIDDDILENTAMLINAADQIKKVTSILFQFVSTSFTVRNGMIVLGSIIILFTSAIMMLSPVSQVPASSLNQLENTQSLILKKLETEKIEKTKLQEYMEKASEFFQMEKQKNVLSSRIMEELQQEMDRAKEKIEKLTEQFESSSNKLQKEKQKNVLSSRKTEELQQEMDRAQEKIEKLTEQFEMTSNELQKEKQVTTMGIVGNVKLWVVFIIYSLILLSLIYSINGLDGQYGLYEGIKFIMFIVVICIILPQLIAIITRVVFGQGLIHTVLCFISSVGIRLCLWWLIVLISTMVWGSDGNPVNEVWAPCTWLGLFGVIQLLCWQELNTLGFMNVIGWCGLPMFVLVQGLRYGVSSDLWAVQE